MEIYIEYALIQNVIIDYFLLFLSASAVAFKPKKIRLALASLLGAAASIIFPYISSAFVVNVYKLALSFVMVCIALGKTTTKKSLFAMFSLCLFTYGFGGVIYALGGEQFASGYALPSYLMWLICGGIVIFFILVRLWTKSLAKKQTRNTYTYEVTFVNGDKTFSSLAYLDSGNNLVDKDNSPVTIITPKVLANLCDISLENLVKQNFDSLTLKDKHYILYNTISTSSKMFVFKVDKLQIKHHNTTKTLDNVSCGLSFKKINNYSALLNCQQI